MMNHNKQPRRILAMALSVVMVLGMLPVSAAAENLPGGTSGEITAFEKLADATATQTVPLGTSLEDLDLPETLTATVRLAADSSEPEQDVSEPVQDSGEPQQEETLEVPEAVTNTVPLATVSGAAVQVSEESEESQQEEPVQDSGEDESDAEYTETTVSVPVIWAASPDYDGDKAGAYTFTAEISGFTVSAELPTITVTVGQAAVKGTITAFDELTDDIRWQNTTEPVFPETLTGTVEGQSAQIPVTWEADHDYDSDSPATGLYVFTAKPGDGYALAGDVEAPRITVYIPAAKRMMLRMVGNGTTQPLEITTAAQLAEIAVLVNNGRLESFLANDSSAVITLKLMNDLDLSAYGEDWNGGKGWVSIGTGTSNPFKGTFDGNDNKITGLFINRTEDLTGLFGYVDGGTVKNLELEEVSITGGDATGGVAGFVDGGSVTNCHLTGSITGDAGVGGVAGYAYGSMKNCNVTGSVSGAGGVGGVAGYASSGSITNCSVTGSISGAGDIGHVGGVVGSTSGNVTNCYAASTVTGKGDMVGGVVGYLDHANSSVANCYATGSVTGVSNSIGGVVGSVGSGSVTNCYATGAVSGSENVGGVAGFVAYGNVNVTNCAALNSSVRGAGDVGRVAGLFADGTLSGNAAFSGMTVKVNNVDQPISSGTANNMNGADITSADITTGSYWITSVNWDNPTVWTLETGKMPILAAISADVQDAAIPPHLAGGSSSYFLGEGTSAAPYQISTAEQLANLAELVNDSATNAAYGGKDIYYKLTADLDLSTYGKNFNSGKGWVPIGTTNTNSFQGTFDGNDNKITGLFINRSEDFTGLFGYIVGTVKNLELEEVSINGSTHTGGVAGYVDSTGSIENCSVTGTVSGSTTVGGIVGSVSLNSETTSCYVTGSVTGDNSVGGITGSVLSNSSVTNCYATGSVTGVGNSIGGVVGDVGNGSVTNCYATSAVSGSSKIGGVAGNANGSVKDCAALNPSVSGSSNVGRVAGAASGTLSANMAFDGMTDPGVGKFGTIANNSNDNNGADISASVIKADGTINGYFTDTSVWTTESGKLPTLKNAAGTQDGTIPPHLVGGSSPYFLGTGAEATPYLIGNAAQLAKLAELVNDSATNAAYGGKDIYYKLTANLDLSAYGKNFNSGKGWVPIGTTNTNSFQGTFDGNNKKITGLYINRTEQNIGLFGYLLNGTVKQLGLEKVNVTGVVVVGGVVGNIDSGSSVTNCYVTGAVSGEIFVGGVAGWVNGSVTSCYVTGTVGGTSSSIGGVAGNMNYGSSVTNCYVTGTVSGGDNVGGVAGWVNGSLTNSYATGAVSGSEKVGGVAGYAGVGVTNCAALNPSGSGSGEVGRVAGVDAGGVLSANRAFSGMKVNGSIVSGGAANNADGANITSGQMNAASFWTTAANWDTTAWDTTVWTIADGKLPTLKNVGGTQSGDSGLYLMQRDIAGATVTVNGSYTYTGSLIAPSLTVTFGGAELVLDEDYEIIITSTDGAGTSAGTNTGTVTLKLTGKGNFSGEKTGVSFVIGKADGPSAPTSVIGSYTGDGSTFTYTVNEIPGAEYSKDGSSWQDSNVFTGFTTSSPETTFYARIKETSTHKAGAAGNTGAVTFKKLNHHTAPALNYTVSGSDFPKTVTITEVPGAEYQFNSGGYSQTRTFTSNSAEDVMLHIRLKETATHNASPATSVTVNTANQNQSAPPAFTLTYASVNDASYSVTIPATAGAEYSFDGTTWSGENTKTGSQPGDSITGYKRMAAKSGYNASSSTSDSVTLPLFQVKTPTASPNGGTFTTSQSVTFSCQTAGVQIYYTTDGSTPTVGSTLYSTPFTLTATATVKVIAVKTGMTDSGVSSVTFTKQSSGDNGGSNGGGGDSSSGSRSIITTTTSEKKPNQPVTAAASVTATAGTNGAASASIPDKAVTDAIAKAQSDATSQGKTVNGISVELDVMMPKGTVSLTTTLTRSSLDSLVSAGVSNLEINGSLVKVSFDKKALAEIQKQSTGNISIAIAPKTNLSDAAKKMIGTRPVYDITVGYGSGKSVSSFGGGVATVSIPYTLGKNEAVGGLYAVYVDAKGNATRIAGSAYDTNSGCVIFTTTHFSQYGIGYTAPTAKFTDISTHWAKESVDYVVGRGLLSGTSDTAFSPNSAMTRGMLVTALGRLAGVDVKAYTTNSFTDVNADSAYRPYIEWAYSKGIIQGIGGSQFAPDRAITREEIAVIFANYAKATGYTLPITREATTYADASSIGSAYKDAVKAMQQAGIMMGGSDNKFNPKGNATRAEVSSMLGRYIKLTINPDTAQGWTLNDAGQYLYYKDGKALTGTQTIDGVKYFFNTDGTLKTGWVKDGDNWRFYSGKTMLVGFWDLGANGSNKRYYFTKEGIMIAGKWLEVDGKWYYFNADGTLAKSMKIDGYEVDENGVRKTK